MAQVRGLKFTIKGGPGSGHRGHAGRPGQIGGSTPSSSLSVAGIGFYVNPGGKALAEGRCTVEQMTKEEFTSLFGGQGMQSPANSLELGKKHGWESPLTKRADAINGRARIFAGNANKRHRAALRKTYPDLPLVGGVIIYDITAVAAWELMMGNS